ncbi:MAG: MliC family protein [Hyphomonadaceae bacterium]
MRALAALAAALALAACQTPCPAVPTGPVHASFTCEDGSSLDVTFNADSARIAQEGYVTLDLPLRISGSGSRYAESGAELRQRGAETRWSRPGAAETVCTRTPTETQ